MSGASGGFQASSETEMGVVNSNSSKSPSSSTTAPIVAKSAREAFKAGDIEASLAYHAAQRQAGGQIEAHGNAAGPYLKALVYGGVDGIITTFATVTSVAGANLAPIVIVIVGICHLVSDAVGMGIGDMLSEQAEIENYHSERKREAWEMHVSMEQEVEEMIELYVQRGISPEDSRRIWTILAKYPEAFLDVMMVEELRLLPPDPDEEPWKSGVVTGVSFSVFGSIPLLPFFLTFIPGLEWVSASAQMNMSIILTVLTLFVLGVLKARLVELGDDWWRSGLVIAGLGSFAAALSYVAGVLLTVLFDVNV